MLTRTLRYALPVLILAAAPAAAADIPPGAVYTQATIVSGDGTSLQAHVLRPEHMGDRPVPVILNVSPYNGYGPVVSATINGAPPSDGPPPGYPELYGTNGLFERGYAYVQVDLRGYGGSEGCGDLMGPRERADVKAAVEWAASQPWSTGRVGMFGKSYDGWTGMAAIAERARGLAAVVAMAPPTALRLSHEQSEAGVAYSNWRVLPAYYHALQLDPPGPQEPDCYASQLAGVQQTGPSPFWNARDLRPSLRGAKVPVLYSQGFLEHTVRPDHALTTWPVLGRQPRIWLGQFDHVRPYLEQTGRDGFIAETLAFFDRYVRRAKPKRKAEPLPQVVIQDSDGRWRAERRWPPADAHGWHVRVREGSFRAEDRNYAEPTFKHPVTRSWHPSPGPFGKGTWTFTPELERELRIAGAPRLDVTVSAAPAGAQLIALLYDISPSGAALLIARGPRALGGTGRYTVELSAQDWRVAPGHRLGLLLTGADDGVYEPAAAAGDVTVTGGSIALPVLTKPRTSFLPGGPSPDIAQRGTIEVDP